ATVKRLLGNLASKLPPNAGHAVLNSLSLWDAQAGNPEVPKPRRHRVIRRRAFDTSGIRDDVVARCLREQGFVWYAMLAGEVGARDLLRLSDYVGTAEQVVQRLRELAWTTLKHFWFWVLLALALIGGGAYLLLKSPHIAAGVASVVAGLGLTWKG